MRLNEGAFAEIDLAVQEYLEHVRKYDAPISVEDCINFVCDETGISYEEIVALEDNQGEISNMLSQNESFAPKSFSHQLREAKQTLRERGYILKKL